MKFQIFALHLCLLPAASIAFGTFKPSWAVSSRPPSTKLCDSASYLDDLSAPGGNNDDDEEKKQPEVSEINETEAETKIEPKPETGSEPRVDTSQLIQSILRVGASTDRGQFATPSEKANIEKIIADLESSYSASEESPTLSPSISGSWDLLYSDTQLFRSSPFFMAGRAVCRTEEEARQYDWFCDMHRAALAISNIGKVRQIISNDGRMVSEFEVKVGSVPFLSDFTPFKYSGGLPVTIDGAIVSSADITPTNEGKAWEIFMDTVEIKGSNIPFLRQALDSYIKLQSRDLGSFLETNVSDYTNPKPIFETTYLDDSLRISRDQDGKIFVYGKSSDNTEPTDYTGVDADLGILDLMKGFNDSILKFYI